MPNGWLSRCSSGALPKLSLKAGTSHVSFESSQLAGHKFLFTFLCKTKKWKKTRDRGETTHKPGVCCRTLSALRITSTYLLIVSKSILVWWDSWNPLKEITLNQHVDPQASPGATWSTSPKCGGSCQKMRQVGGQSFHHSCKRLVEGLLCFIRYSPPGAVISRAVFPGGVQGFFGAQLRSLCRTSSSIFKVVQVIVGSKPWVSGRLASPEIFLFLTGDVSVSTSLVRGKTCHFFFVHDGT